MPKEITARVWGPVGALGVMNRSKAHAVPTSSSPPSPAACPRGPPHCCPHGDRSRTPCCLPGTPHPQPVTDRHPHSRAPSSHTPYSACRRQDAKLAGFLSCLLLFCLLWVSGTFLSRSFHPCFFQCSAFPRLSRSISHRAIPLRSRRERL